MRFSLLVSFFLFHAALLLAQPNKRISRTEYIETYKDIAIKEMIRSGVPASITLAQGILESGDGNSKLAREANNHFGIKCHSSWRGKTFYQDDDAKDECFRKYKHALESYKDHSEFLLRPRYAALFELKTTDYKGWAYGLKKAGYATNPKYPQLLIKIIEDNNLYVYDQKIKIKKIKDSELLVVESEGKKSNKKEKLSFTSNGYKILVHENNIKYIVPEEGETLENLAQQLNMGLWQLYKYNDLEKGEELENEKLIFIQPKRSKAKENYHIVEKGESLWDISQEHGIKLKKIYKRNDLEKGAQPKIGDKIILR